MLRPASECLTDTVQEAALAAIPKMLPEDAGVRQGALDMVKRILMASAPLGDEAQARLARIARLFGLTETAAAVDKVVPLPPTRAEIQSKAS